LSVTLVERKEVCGDENDISRDVQGRGIGDGVFVINPARVYCCREAEKVRRADGRGNNQTDLHGPRLFKADQIPGDEPDQPLTEATSV